MRKLLIALVVIVSSAGFLIAQDTVSIQVDEVGLDQFLDLVKADIRQQRAELVGAAMQMSAEQAAIFWPVYREFELEAAKLTDADFDIVTEYANSFRTMTDAKAHQLASTVFTIDHGRLTLRKLYFERLERELGGVVAVRFLQIDNQLNMLLDLQIASRIPLIQHGQ